MSFEGSCLIPFLLAKKGMCERLAFRAWPERSAPYEEMRASPRVPRQVGVGLQGFRL